MSWFPTFLNPWLAAAAAAIAIPSLLILYFLKLRRRELAVSSTFLWKKSIQDLQVNAPFQRLRRNLLLLLQLILLALLLLALARPVSNYTPGAGKMTVILIDRSASMAAKDVDAGKHTRLEEAKRRAKDLVETLDRKSSAMVIAFDETAETVQPFTTDVPALKNAIDGIRQTDRKSRLKLAYQLADAQTNFNPEQLRPGGGQLPDVWLYSDGRVLDPQDLAIRGKVTFDKIGTEEAGNVAIVAMSGKRTYERPTEVQVFARLANYGPDVVKADVQLSVDDKVRTIAGTNLVPERWSQQERDKAEAAGEANRDSVEFTLDLTESAVLKVEQMRKEGDALASDDVAQVIVPPPKTLSVLLVSNGNFFIEKLFNVLELKSPDTMIPAAYEQNVPNKYDVVIFDNYSPKALPPSGNFIYFGGVAAGLKLKAVKEDIRNVLLENVGVLDWQRDHPILRHLSLQPIVTRTALKLDVPAESQVLIEGTKGPLLVLHREGQSTHLVFAFDYMESNLPVRPTFPVIMYNALQYLAVGADMSVRQAFDPGATPRIPRGNIDRASPGLKKITLNGPMGSRSVPIPDAGDFALPALDLVGVYTIDPPVPQYDRIAVNLLDASESNLVPVEKAPGGIGETLEVGSGKSRLELWWWIVACAALPMLLIEWWVYTRRVHL
jgi:hypothetical protein